MAALYDALTKIGFDWQVALANLFNFLIILFILKKFAFKPVKKILEDRQAAIQKGLEDAQRAKTEVMMAEETKKQIVLDAQKEAGEILVVAQKENQKILKNAKEKAKQEAGDILTKAQEQNQKELQALQKAMKAKSVDLVVDSAAKLFTEKMDSEHDRKYIKKVIEGFSYETQRD